MRVMSFFLVVAIVLTFTGCLSIGGKTSYISHTDQTLENRVVQLENRINSLEQLAGISPPSSEQIVSASKPDFR